VSAGQQTQQETWLDVQAMMAYANK
jgi:hypothetical protein